MESEIWKPVIGFDGYEVSSTGRVRSLDRIIEYPNYLKRQKGRVKNQRKDSKGRYMLVDLYKDKRSVTCLVHRLVYEAFNDSLKNLEVNHINGICYDNRIENLEAVTRSENEKHKYEALGYKGTSFGKSGNLHSRSRKVAKVDLKSNQILEVYGSIREAERMTGTFSSCITQCCNGKQNKSNGYKWKYVD